MNQTIEPTAESKSETPTAEVESAPLAVDNEVAERKKAKSRAANRAAVQLLCETYPQTFSVTEPKPLKIGIQEDLVADGKISQNKIKRGLASYVRIYAYLRSQSEGAARVNLLGEAAGKVTSGEAAHAASKLPAQRESKPRNKSNKAIDKRGARRPNKSAKPVANKKPAPNSQAKVKKADNPFQGLDDNQRMASKLDLLLNKHR
ncbi:MAG: ProQ/FinO family protein [Gammaproteobacteria bacterium]|nr:ProQ/FinO family protein [Gammaproteobacteria bacterium]